MAQLARREPESAGSRGVKRAEGAARFIDVRSPTKPPVVTIDNRAA